MMQNFENTDLLKELERAIKEHQVEGSWPKFLDFFEERMRKGDLKSALSMARRVSASGLTGDLLVEALARRAEYLGLSGTFGEEFDECIHQALYQAARNQNQNAKARILRTLADCHFSCGESALGESYLRKSIDLRGISLKERLLGLYLLGINLEAAGQTEKALRTFQEMLAILEEDFDPPIFQQDQVKIQAISAHTQAILAIHQLKLDRAQNLLRDAIKLLEDAFGRYHPCFSAALHHLARLCRLDHRPEAALPALELCTAIKETVLGTEHSDFAASLAELGMAIDAQGREEEACDALKRAVEIYDQNGVKGIRATQAFEYYAVLLLRQGKAAEAEPWAVRAFEEYQDLNQKAGQINLLRILGEIYLRLGRIKESAIFARRAVDWAKENLPETHPLQASTLQTLGLTQDGMGLYDEALNSLREALAIGETLGLDRRQRAACLHNIGGVLGRQGHYAAAIESLTKACALEEDPKMGCSPQSLATLGGLQSCLAQEDKAEESLTRAFELAVQNFPEGHPERLSIRTALADLIAARGRLKEAKALLEEGEEEAKELALKNHPAAANWYMQLADFTLEQGNHAEAEEILLRAQRIAENCYGAGHPDHTAILRQLALTRAARGDYREARQWAEQALKADESCFGLIHPSTSASLSAFAQILILCGEFDPAERMLYETLEHDLTFFAIDHPSCAHDHRLLAEALTGQGQYEQAISEIKIALEIDHNHFGPSHPAVWADQTVFAQILDHQDRASEGLPVIEAAIEGELEFYGEPHPVLAQAYGILGSLFEHQDRLEEGHQALSKALNQADEIYGLHHPSRVSLLSRFASISLALADAQLEQPDRSSKFLGEEIFREAEIFAREAWSIGRETLGALHPETATAAHVLSLILFHADRLEEALKMAKEALSIKNSILSEDHPERGMTLCLMGQIEIAMDQKEEGKEHLETALSILTQSLGPDHRETKEARDALT